MDTNEAQQTEFARFDARPTKKQWTAIATVSGATGVAAGPIAAAGAAVGMLGGCYVSKRMEWSEN